MTKQEAIDLLDNLIGMIEDNHGSDYDSAIRMAIDALEPQWIPCSERLPDVAQRVLLSGHGTVGLVGCIALVSIRLNRQGFRIYIRRMP